MSRIDWPNAYSPIARILYESVSAADERRRLGEYAAPDRLAREIVDTLVMDPLIQRVLHPACGSGAVIFASARKYLTPAGSKAAKSAAQAWATRQASGRGCTVTIARRELRSWWSESAEGMVVEELMGRLLG